MIGHMNHVTSSRLFRRFFQQRCRRFVGIFNSGHLGALLPLGLCIGLALPTQAQIAADAEPVRMAMNAFGGEAQIEVRDMDRSRAEQAIQKALTEIHQVQLLLNLDADTRGGLAQAQAGVGREVAVDPRIADLLARATQYCLWSSGSLSPVGGAVERLWEQRDASGEGFHPQDLRDALQTATCDKLSIRNTPQTTVKIEQGSRLTTFGIGRGFAADRAVAVLQQEGVVNAFVEIGHVVRAIGPGPDGKGWMVVVPGTSKTRNPLDQIWLRNQSLAVIRKGERRRIDHRKGVSGLGVVQVAAVSELAVDTQALAHVLFVNGMTEGQRLIGYLNPKPSIFWLLGNGVGVPLESQYRWSELSRSRNTFIP